MAAAGGPAGRRRGGRPTGRRGTPCRSSTRGDPALADPETQGAALQAQPLVAVGGQHGRLVDAFARLAQGDPLGGQEFHDRRPGHPEHRGALLHRHQPVAVGGGHGFWPQPHRPSRRRGEHVRQDLRTAGGRQGRAAAPRASAAPPGLGDVTRHAADVAPPEPVAGEGVSQRRQFAGFTRHRARSAHRAAQRTRCLRLASPRPHRAIFAHSSQLYTRCAISSASSSLTVNWTCVTPDKRPPIVIEGKQKMNQQLSCIMRHAPAE